MNHGNLSFKCSTVAQCAYSYMWEMRIATKMSALTVSLLRGEVDGMLSRQCRRLRCHWDWAEFPFDKTLLGFYSASTYSVQFECEKRGLLGVLSSSVATSTTLSVSSDLLCLRVVSPWQQAHDRRRETERGERGGEIVNCEGVDSFANFAMLLKPQMRKGAGLERQTNSQWEAHVVS